MQSHATIALDVPEICQGVLTTSSWSNRLFFGHFSRLVYRATPPPISNVVLQAEMAACVATECVHVKIRERRGLIGVPGRELASCSHHAPIAMPWPCLPAWHRDAASHAKPAATSEGKRAR